MKEYQYHRRIVCAANRNHVSGEIVLGARHFDNLMREGINNIISVRGESKQEKSDWFSSEQGFIDQHGEFLTREEAWIVAEEAGQIIRRVGGDMSPDGVGKLFSESLY